MLIKERALSPTLAQRFWKRVVKTPGCWLWAGNRTGYKRGYGKMYAGPGFELGAHVISWILHFGHVPSGKQVLHKCDNPSCVRPEHLEVGTQKENIRQMLERKRHYSPFVEDRPIGESNPFSKLTDVEVNEIRRRYARGNITQTRLGALYGVAQSTISGIVRLERWNHLD